MVFGMKKLRFGFWGAVLALALPQLGLASEPIVVFGLTNVALGQAILMGNVVTNLSSNGLDGVSIFLGEADAGVFAYPDTFGSPTHNDYMLGKAYGKLNGVPDQLLCTVRGRKVAQSGGDGIYPLTLDFSALGVTNFLAQVFNRSGGLVAQADIGSGDPIIRTDFNGGKITRVNPFWRTRDGAIAVVLDFPTSTGFELPVTMEPREVPFIRFGRRLVLRALNPTGVVEFVSRVDVTTGVLDEDEEGEGLSTFHMNEMRLGVFGRPHKALGDVALHARGGTLQIARLHPDELEPQDDFIEGTGVHIEWDRASKSTVDFRPVDLSGTNAQFGVTAMVRLAGSVWYFGTYVLPLGSLRLRQTTNGLTLVGVFERLGTNAQQVRMAVYRAGELVGSSPVLELENSLFPTVTISGNPRVLRAGAQGNTLDAPPGVGLTFDTATTFSFTMTNGTETVSFEGDEVKFLSVGPVYVEFPLVEAWVEIVDAILVNSRGLTDFTISGEREDSITPPTLSIARAGGQVNLSWPDPNRTYYLQTSSDLAAGFNWGGVYPDNSNPIATASDPITTTNQARFYRLIHGGAVD